MNTFTVERNKCRRRLILMVKQHPILWNKTQENYNRNRPQKLQTWQEISEQIGISVDKIRRIWENLRDQYRRDLKREVKYGFKSKWRFFTDMDFIREMVTCKGQPNEFTDSDSEMEPNEMQQFSDYDFEMDTTYTEPPKMTIANSASAVDLNFTPASPSKFQPILLSKHWQNNNNVSDLSALLVQLPQTAASQTIAPGMPPPPYYPAPEVQQRCDSSKDYSRDLPNPIELMEMLAKREPESDIEIESECVAPMMETKANRCVPLTPPATAPALAQITQGFHQEAHVSTSSRRRPSLPREDSQLELPQSNKRPQENSALPNPIELMEMLAKREPDSDIEIESECTAPLVKAQPNTFEPLTATLAAPSPFPAEFNQEAHVSTSSLKRPNIPMEDNLSESPRSSSATNKRKKSLESADLEVRDEDYYFVMSLLPSMRQIPRSRKFGLRIGIMNLIAKDLEEVCK